MNFSEIIIFIFRRNRASDYVIKWPLMIALVGLLPLNSLAKFPP